jgi:RNA polymerase sigma-70 factor (ECF subfamily)
MAGLSEDDVADAYRRYFPMILRKSRRMLRSASEAQDLAQETFLRLWQSRLNLRDVAATTGWLYRTCTRLAIDRLRSGAHSARPSVDAAAVIPSDAASAEEATHHRRLLENLVGVLPRAEVEAALLSRVDGLNHQEIGEVLRVSERTVRRLLARADARIAAWRARHEVAA